MPRIDNALIIAKREYLSRIRTKGFWIGTVVLPVFMLSMTVLPSLLLSRVRGTLRVAVVDETARIAPALAERLARRGAAADPAERAPSPSSGRDRRPEASEIELEIVPRSDDGAAQRAELDRRVLAKEVDAWLWIERQGLEKERSTIEYHGENVSNFVTQARLENAVSRAVRDWRLAEAGYDAAKIAELSREVSIETTRVTSTGGRAEGGMAGFFLAYSLFFLLYLVIMIYGQQVLNGVLEEKTSRIVEVIVATTTPFELMLGKLVGICGVALTQVIIWLGTAVLVTTPGMLTAAAIGGLSIPRVPISLMVHFSAFFVIGFFIYSSLYAAIGSAYNDIKEAQQAASSMAFILMPCVFLMFPTINNPDSTLAVVASLIPFFTPLLMVLRIAVKTPPAWQIALGYLLSLATVIAMAWAAGKVYRVGILMHGKKPTLPEIWRWMRYS